jgi:predicted phage replisome organizer
MNISWLKLDVNILDDSKIKVIRSHPDGDTIVLLWIGILCLAMKSMRPGLIEISDGIPYTADDLANLFGIEKKTVELGLMLFYKYKMIDVFDGGCIEVINFARHQSLETIDRRRELGRQRTARYRERLRLPHEAPEKNSENPEIGDASLTRYSVTRDAPVTQQNRIDKSRVDKNRKEKDVSAKIPANRFIKPTLQEVTDYCNSRNNGIDPQYFLCYQEARGWLLGGKSPIKNWKAAINTWERNSRARNASPQPSQPDEIEALRQKMIRERGCHNE